MLLLSGFRSGRIYISSGLTPRQERLIIRRITSTHQYRAETLNKPANISSQTGFDPVPLRPFIQVADFRWRKNLTSNCRVKNGLQIAENLQSACRKKKNCYWCANNCSCSRNVSASWWHFFCHLSLLISCKSSFKTALSSQSFGKVNFPKSRSNSSPILNEVWINCGPREFLAKDLPCPYLNHPLEPLENFGIRKRSQRQHLERSKRQKTMPNQTNKHWRLLKKKSFNDATLMPTIICN